MAFSHLTTTIVYHTFLGCITATASNCSLPHLYIPRAPTSVTQHKENVC